MPQSILIVGCGIAGSTLAAFLLASPELDGIQVTLLERAPDLRPQGQNVDIRGSGVSIMKKLGIEATVKASLTEEIGAQWVDSSNRVWGAFAADKTGKVQTGTSDIEILRGRLAQICYDKCVQVSKGAVKDGKPGVDFIFGDYLESLTQDADKVHVTFAKSKKSATYDLVVAADGLLSRTRELVIGKAEDEACVRNLGVYGAFFSLPKGGADTMWRRWYRAPKRRAIMIRPHERKDMSTVYMYVIDDEGGRLKDIASSGRPNVEAQKALLAEVFEDAGWETPRVIEQMHKADDFYYSPMAQIKMDNWSRGRVVFVGDAGYCASPMSGQGTTLAMSGAYVLAGALSRHPHDHKAAFAFYQERMRPLVDDAQKLPMNGRAFHVTGPETWWGILILNMIMGFVYYSGTGTLLAMFIKPGVEDVSVENYGFRQL